MTSRIYAFDAKTKEQAAVLEARGAVYYPTMKRWVARDLSGWGLRRLKSKGLVPEATPMAVETEKPPLKWPFWIKVVTFGPPVALAVLCFWLAQNTQDFPVFNNILFVGGFFAFWSVFSNFLSKLAYAFYRKLRGDRRYWETLTDKRNWAQNNNDSTIKTGTTSSSIDNSWDDDPNVMGSSMWYATGRHH